MADRTSAELFSTMFEMLAENPTDEHKAMALKLWEKQYNFDFSPYQMGCEEALVTLGLAERGLEPGYEEDGEVWLYGPKDKRHS